MKPSKFVKLSLVCLVTALVALPSAIPAQEDKVPELTVKLDRKTYQMGDTLVGEVIGLARREKVTIQLKDSFDRLLAEVKADSPQDKAVQFAFALDIPFTIQEQVVASSASGKKGSASFILTPHDYQWDDYHVILWGGPAEEPKKYFDTCRRLGIDVGMLYRGNDPTPFVENNFRYYVENMLPKGELYLRREDWKKVRSGFKATGDRKLLTRNPCLNDPKTIEKWKELLDELILPRQKHRPRAYNLGDEISVTSFTQPFDFCFGPYCLAEFRRWLKVTYPSLDGLNREWGTRFRSWGEVEPFTTAAISRREFVQRKKLLNFSPWADHRSFMDTTFAKTLARLVSYCNTLDPLVPVGMEGGQAPSAFGGYDWWKLMQVTQWQEPYDAGQSREIIRSFNLAKTARIPVLATLFTKKTGEAAKLGKHQVWRLFIHGDRGTIIWRDQIYFDKDYKPTGYAQAMADTFSELRHGPGKLFAHPHFHMEPDPIAIYYSQASIQAHWILDSRPGTGNYSTLSRDRASWVKLLEDAGFQYNFLSYQQIAEGELLQRGYRVLIMPKTIALDEREVQAIKRFVSAGGLLVGDSQVGLMDGHCKMEAVGRLDELFGIRRQGYRSAEVAGKFTPVTQAKLTAARVAPSLAKLITGVNLTNLNVIEPDILPIHGRALASAGGIPAIIVNDVDNGHTAYLNIAISHYLNARKDEKEQEAYQRLLQNLLAWTKLEPRIRVKLLGKDMPSCERIIYRLGNAHYLTIQANASRARLWSAEGTFQIEGLPSADEFTIDVDLGDIRAHVYNMRKGGQQAYKQYTSYFRDTMVPWEANLYALLPYRVDKIEFTGKLERNRILPFTIRVVPRNVRAEVGTHVLHLSLLDSAGKEVPNYEANLVTIGGIARGKIQLALSEPPGNYQLKARDVATGITGVLEFKVTARP